MEMRYHYKRFSEGDNSATPHTYIVQSLYSLYVPVPRICTIPHVNKMMIIVESDNLFSSSSAVLADQSETVLQSTVVLFKIGLRD